MLQPGLIATETAIIGFSQDYLQLTDIQVMKLVAIARYVAFDLFTGFRY
ncbi:hypothetical protein [Kamptonema sp. UHCC 0994]|nr:hypothetical protein [Kamptonema sp. UHCC 0994]MDF0556367.1 hypothetical protein [Kamptonema sp. UHCC 0994]